MKCPKSWAPVLGLLLVAPVAARGQEACKATTLKNSALTLSEVYAKSEKLAKAWKPDAVPAQVGNTVLGPLQPDGSSIAWNLRFYSDRAKSQVAINTFRGTLTCWAMPGSAGRIPDLQPEFFRDGARLYAIAADRGGDLIRKGYGVMVGTAATPGSRHATWYLNFTRDQGQDGGLSVIVDANTGVLENVLR